MKIALTSVLLISLLQIVAGSNITEMATTGLHCFTCTSTEYPNCGDPFNATEVPIVEYHGKSVCYKFRKDSLVQRGGALLDEYLQQYENGGLDEFPLRTRCSNMLCNGGGQALPLLSSLAGTALALVLFLAAR